jgi:trimethylamine--corrinoid protein Co-methyltransferase
MADEIIRQMRFVVGGIEVSERTLAREAIRHVEPGKGFLADDHTLRNWKWAQWKPSLVDRSRYDRWVEQGRADITARANQRARSILATHTPTALTPESEQVIAQVLSERSK